MAKAGDNGAVFGLVVIGEERRKRMLGTYSSQEELC